MASRREYSRARGTLHAPARGTLAGYPQDMDVRIVQARQDDLEALAALIARIEAEDSPNDPAVAARAPAGLRRSVRAFNPFDSPTTWILLAIADDLPAGLAILVRIPKLDDRIGFLYLDELHVLAPWRRRGIGTRLINRTFEIASSHRLAGIRLLARPENAAARASYERWGFAATENLLYQRRIEAPRSAP